MSGVVRVARSYRADAQRVYDAWLDPALAGRWLFATATRPMTDVSIDARIDGAFRFARHQDGGGGGYAGEYIALVPARRIVFSLSPRDEMGATQVSVDFATRRTGCRLALAHAGIPAPCARQLRARWMGVLYGLGATLDLLRDAPAQSPAIAGRMTQGEAQCITC